MKHNLRSLLSRIPSLVLVTVLLGSGGCASRQIELAGDFPVPLVPASPMRVAIVLSPELTGYVHAESIARQGDYSVNVGTVQKQLFQRLAQGTFSGHTFTSEVGITDYDGTLMPVIQDLQFSTPKQTRTDYYEVWIRYRFDLYDQQATKIGSWDLPAYGKANQANYRNNNEGLFAAAIAACRDMAAMFSLNFSTTQAVNQWQQSTSPEPAAQTDMGSNP